MMGDIGFKGFTALGNEGQGLQLGLEIGHQVIGPPAIQLIEPPEGEGMPADVEGFLMHAGQLGDVFGPRIGPDQEGAGRLPDHPVFLRRVDRYPAPIGQALPILSKMRLGQLGAADG